VRRLLRISQTPTATMSLLLILQIIQLHPVPLGLGPYGVAVTPDRTKYVTYFDGSNNVSVINTTNNTAYASVPVGSQPYGVAVNPAGTKAYVTN
jgi:YVTN family beta-propeller protein